MYATTVEDLYEAVESRGGLTARLRLEVLVGDLRAAAGASAVSSPRDRETIPSPYNDTIRSALS